MISLSTDTTEAEPRKFVTANSIRWPQGFLDERLKTSVEQEYGFTSVPQALLVGPDGRLVATNLRGPNIKEAVAKALTR